MKRPIAIDLFAGCGDMSLGLKAAGFDIAVAVEFSDLSILEAYTGIDNGILAKDLDYNDRLVSLSLGD